MYLRIFWKFLTFSMHSTTNQINQPKTNKMATGSDIKQCIYRQFSCADTGNVIKIFDARVESNAGGV